MCLAFFAYGNALMATLRQTSAKANTAGKIFWATCVFMSLLMAESAIWIATLADFNNFYADVRLLPFLICAMTV